MKVKLTFILMFVLSIMLMAQEVTTNWSRTALGSNPYTWFSTSSLERGMAYNPVTNHVLVVSRNGGTFVKVIDAITGEDVGDLDVTGIAGGTYVLNAIDVTDDGSIYAVNLAIGVGAFKVYKWADESATPVVVIENNLGGISKRIGDKFTVVGSDADNTTQIWLADPTSGNVFALETADNGTTFSVFATVAIPGGIGSSPDVYPVLDPESEADFVINGNGKSASAYNMAGEFIGSIDGGLVATGSNAIFFTQMSGHDFVGTFAYGAGNENCRIVDVTDMTLFAVTPSMLMNSNANGTGDVDFYMNAEGDLVVYVLSTNNGIGSYTISAPMLPEAIADVEVDANNDFAPDRIGETVMVQGVVNSVNFTASANRFSYVIQDETGGINITKGTQPGGEPVYQLGDMLLVSGQVSQYRGQNQLDLTEEQLGAIQLVEQVPPPMPMEISIADFLADAEHFEGMLVKIMNVSPIASSPAWPAEGSEANMIFTDGNGEIIIRIDKDTDIDGMPEPAWPVHVVGVGTQFTFSSPANDGYQITPNFYSDFQGVPGQVTTKFQVDMTYEISGGNFNPANDAVTVRGSFNDWSASDVLTPNATNSNIYEGWVTREFAANDMIFFKYVYEGTNGTVWENDPNREYTYTADDISSGNAVIMLTTFNNYIPGGDLEVTFVADMTYELATGNFDPMEDVLYTRGNFNGWSTDDVLSVTGDPNIYSVTTTLNLSAGAEILYKYYYEGPGGSAWEGGDNRVYTVTEDDVNAGMIELSRVFNDLNPSIILMDDATVKFRVNTNGAVDMNGVPFNTIDNVGVLGSVAPLQWPNGGWPDEDSTKVIWLNDSGIMGDEVAGDNVWSRDITFNQYSPLQVFYKYSINYGLPSNNGANDNESSTGVDHSIVMVPNLMSASVEVVQFGTMGEHQLENVMLYGQAGWMMDVVVKDAGGAENSDVVTFGTHPDATDGIDAMLGEEELPPLPPAGAFDTRLILPVTPPVASMTDVRPEGDMITWELYFQPGNAGLPISLTWNSGMLPEGNFRIVDPFGGSLVNVDMKETNMIEVTNPALNTLWIEYSTSVMSDVMVSSGWNLLSVPVLAPDMTKAALFPSATSNAFAFNGGYQIAEELENGAGYWLKFGADETVTIEGLVYQNPVDVVQGWNLVGPFDEAVMVDEIGTIPAGIITSNFFGFEGGYTSADELMPGKGYWVKVSEAGQLTVVPPVAKNGNEEETNKPAEAPMYTIDIATNDGAAGSYALALGIDPAATDGIDSDLGETELPPLPPAGVYDARFILGDNTTGTPKDYRTGDNNYTGQVTYKMNVQYGDGATALTLDVNVPQVPGTVTVTVKDVVLNGGIVNEVLNEGVGQVVVTNMNVNSLYVIVDYNAPIPVELTSFAANVVGETIQLVWETATETNNKGFEVERSSDNETFTQIGKIEGHGTTAEKQSYNFTDHNATSGTYYYRLRQVDFDGTSTYSDVVEVEFIPTEYSLGQNYPNPFNPSTKVKFAVPVESKVTVTLYNMLGQKVKELVAAQYNVGLHEVELNASDLASGMYIYSITAQGVDGSNFVDTKKMMLMK